MKTILWILGAAALVIAFSSFTQAGRGKTEQQDYRVVGQLPGLEIRYYPPALVAQVEMPASGYRSLAYPGFRALAAYIFGGNSTGEKVAMTAPVHMYWEDSTGVMQFVMPRAYTRERLPEPANPEVKLKREAGKYVAVLRFGGYASDRDILNYRLELEKRMKIHGLQSAGPFRYLGYDPPFRVWGRTNEIQIPVIWQEQAL